MSILYMIPVVVLIMITIAVVIDNIRFDREIKHMNYVRMIARNL